MYKTICLIITLVIFWHTQNVFCQTSDFQQAIHKDVVQYTHGYTKGEKWENEKKTLATHSQEELTRALITEVDVDTRSIGEIYDRAVGIRTLYKALDLPPTSICQELEKTQPPYRKVVLMRTVEGIDTPEVTAALLRQLNDRRPALDQGKFDGEGAPMHPLRVCDVACNAISYNLEPDLHGFRVGGILSDSQRDEHIQQMLKDLHLSIPQ